MRTAFFSALCRLAERDERIFLLVGDLGFCVADEFAQRFPGRFINAGVAEQNMTGVAAGLALSGKIVFTYSIANFPVLRCLEQIRNDVCYHRANVKIVAVGGGLAYGALGASHHASEDLAIMRSLPEITVVAPGDPIEAGAATEAIANHSGPCYLRLGRDGEPKLHQHEIEFQLGKAIRLRDGSDMTLISSGGLLETALRVSDALASRSISCRVVSMHTLKPLDVDEISNAAESTRAIFTLEEHSTVGGLGSAVAETLVESGSSVAFKKFALPDAFCVTVGSQQFLRREFGLSAGLLIESICAALAKFDIAVAKLA